MAKPRRRHVDFRLLYSLADEEGTRNKPKLDCLPNNLLRKIMTFLDFRMHVRVAGTCRWAAYAAGEPASWPPHVTVPLAEGTFDEKRQEAFVRVFDLQPAGLSLPLLSADSPVLTRAAPTLQTLKGRLDSLPSLPNLTELIVTGATNAGPTGCTASCCRSCTRSICSTARPCVCA